MDDNAAAKKIYNASVEGERRIGQCLTDKASEWFRNNKEEYFSFRTESEHNWKLKFIDITKEIID
uniref:Uncharacterized protein n=1 Tax=Megaselia scalaris TaxID=36166 RepID=T1GTD8_MEGSC